MQSTPDGHKPWPQGPPKLCTEQSQELGVLQLGLKEVTMWGADAV